MGQWGGGSFLSCLPIEMGGTGGAIEGMVFLADDWNFIMLIKEQCEIHD